MVNAQEWLDNNYPINGTCINEDDKENYGKRREEIVELDISNKNLEGPLAKDGGWINLRKLNMSFNNITHGSVGHNSVKDMSNLEEIDYSHNSRSGTWGSPASFPKLKKLNLSNNYIRKADLAHAPELTHLDVSNNQLAELNIPSKNLQELNCSDNPPLTNLSLASDSSPQVTVLVVAFLDLL
ncbi:uncharacterized protein OCT59_008707 [Rhizophagus irregularis]|uniref:Uncharacterized protein n=1 Tax=Rhizophagus irregularis (strain DAOM 181602 / DAOM 197198 / MUCL 43194) TaxID=747089 RepID=A0A2H5SH46_RHIID|nr:hypothetical protein GLOIN_2v1848559 [Rhizophagus irregularis DAOM 181602=DAOM 197198]POG58812.1 hypothetical protein GLOIN_2v1848559 [Rhizophagus irregularis DAOM 181602=DAOM 197198]UZO17351.1 hypothetical protein OCT59_008707 [Rhizophagus irregularis]CAB4488613.1 unnamed protein product [Rhizophagus irregularis]CAB5396498.1 unnamed protein product [Rhizophagus irregularis]|eukprot:XP_025165678.1 hypothetical protein GLOIN_2v1848559 [Rhizophagus irregularis DAOM 181602=DAOM 197198]